MKFCIVVSCFIHHHGYPWFELSGPRSFDTNVGLQPTWGLVCVCSETLWYAGICPIEDHLGDTRREPSALEGWIHEVFDCDPKGSRAFLRILISADPVYGRARCLPIGRIQNRKNLKDTTPGLGCRDFPRKGQETG